MLQNRASQILVGALVGYFATSVVIAGDEQKRAMEEAKSHAETVDTGTRRTVSDAAPRQSVSDAAPRESVSDVAPRQSVSDAAPRESVSDAEPRESISDAKAQHAEPGATATSKLPDGKIRGTLIKSGGGSETSNARDDKQDGLEDKEPRD